MWIREGLWGWNQRASLLYKGYRDHLMHMVTNDENLMTTFFDFRIKCLKYVLAKVAKMLKLKGTINERKIIEQISFLKSHRLKVSCFYKIWDFRFTQSNLKIIFKSKNAKK